MRKVFSLAHRVFLGLFPADLWGGGGLLHQVLSSHSQPEDYGRQGLRSGIGGKSGERRNSCFGIQEFVLSTLITQSQPAIFAGLRSVQNGISPVKTAGVKGNCLKPPKQIQDFHLSPAPPQNGHSLMHLLNHFSWP